MIMAQTITTITEASTKQVYTLGKVVSVIDQGAIRLIQGHDNLIAKLAPRNELHPEFGFMSKYLRPNKIDEIVEERGFTYLPLPYYVGYCMTDIETKANKGKLCAIIMQRLGNVSNAFVYSHDQLKYLLWEVVKALRFIHENGWLHLDISPQNILINTEGNRPYLIDLSCKRSSNRLPQKAFSGNICWCSNLDLPPYRTKTATSDFHQLAHVAIFLAGGTLPWLSQITGNEKRDLRIRENYAKATPSYLVAENEQYFDPILKEWILGLLSLGYDEEINYNSILDFLWQ